MELQFSWFPILLSLFLFTFLLRSSKRTPSKLPPGPRKLPLIGNLHNLAGSFSHRTLRDLSQKYGPLMHLQLGELSLVVASSPDMAKEIMRTHDAAFATRPSILASEVMSYGSKGIVFAPYGDYWRQIRKVCTMELLSAKRVQSFRCVREEEYLKLVRWVASNAGSPINLSRKIFSTSYETTSRIAFGGRSKEHEEFISVVKEVMKLSSGFDVEDLFPSYKFIHMIGGIRPKFEKLSKEADRIIESIIKDHRKKSDRRSDSIAEEAGDDLVDVLLKYERNGDKDVTLTMENVKAIILDIFAAGSDTTATTIEWALSEMIRNPKVLRKAQAEVRKVFEGRRTVDEAELVKLKFLKMVIRETLRYHPPVPLVLPRECRERCEIGGYEIPAKTIVIVNGWAINRDAGCWEKADDFNPKRFRDSSVDFRGNNFEYIPFGAGRRICPGMNFGLANVELPLAMLLFHFDWELPGGMKNEDLDMVEWLHVTCRRKNDLILIPKVYHDPPVDDTNNVDELYNVA